MTLYSKFQCQKDNLFAIKIKSKKRGWIGLELGAWGRGHFWK